MDHFKGTNETERFNNDLLNEIRKTNQLLEQILTNTKPEVQKPTRGKKNVIHSTEGIPVNSISKGQ